MPNQLPSEQELIKRWDKHNKVFLSICCVSYNHAAFIADCLEGFLMQKTDFPFEILINDDASTDGTAKIIRDYHKRYPTIIKPQFQSENQYRKRKGGGMNYEFNMTRARGNYIALCDGDDCWRDPLKLKKQVGFLEKHPDFVLSFHDAHVVDKHNKIIDTHKLNKNQRRDKTARDMVEKRITATFSLVFRWPSNFSYPKGYHEVMGNDSILITALSEFGKAKFQPEVTPAYYRVHSGGVWSLKSNRQKLYNRYKTYTFISNLDINYAANVEKTAVNTLYKIKTFDRGFFEKNIMRHKQFWVWRQGFIYRLKKILNIKPYN